LQYNPRVHFDISWFFYDHFKAAGWGGKIA
jgi:hypothetical protein